METAPPPCVTCGPPRVGPFCSECGQKARARLTVPGLVAEGTQHVLSLDFGLLRTAVDLVRRPAGLIRDVFDGRTVRYAGPVRYFLVAVAVSQLLVLAFGSLESMAEGFNEGRSSAAAFGEEANAPADASDAADAVRRYWVVALAGAVPFVALWSRLLLRRSGLTLAEHATAHLYLIAQMVLGFGLVVALDRAAGGVHEAAAYAVAAVVLGGALGLALWASVGVFRRGAVWSPVAMALSLVLGYAVYGTLLSLGLIALGQA